MSEQAHFDKENSRVSGRVLSNDIRKNSSAFVLQDNRQRSVVQKNELKSTANNNNAPVQRVLDITASKTSPFHVLKYRQFQSLRKRESIDLSVPAWLWLKSIALSPYKVTFGNWKMAVDSYPLYQKMYNQMSQPQPVKSSEFRFGKAKASPLTMNDAHGIVGMTDWIENKYPVANSLYVSPGGSADFFATALRMRGGQVVDIPLSEIKAENLQGKQHERAQTFVLKRFAGAQLKSRIVILDAVKSGSALLILKQMISDVLAYPINNIFLVGLNNPPGAEGQKAVHDGHIEIVPGTTSHMKYAKDRLKNQSYKDAARKYAKNPVDKLTDVTAEKTPTPIKGASEELMVMLLAMHNIASKAFVEKDESDDEDSSEQSE